MIQRLSVSYENSKQQTEYRRELPCVTTSKIKQITVAHKDGSFTMYRQNKSRMGDWSVDWTGDRRSTVDRRKADK